MDVEQLISLDKMSRQGRQQREKTGSIDLDVDKDINLIIVTLSTSIDACSYILLCSFHHRKIITSYLVSRKLVCVFL